MRFTETNKTASQQTRKLTHELVTNTRRIDVQINPSKRRYTSWLAKTIYKNVKAKWTYQLVGFHTQQSSSCTDGIQTQTDFQTDSQIQSRVNDHMRFNKHMTSIAIKQTKRCDAQCFGTFTSAMTSWKLTLCLPNPNLMCTHSTQHVILVKSPNEAKLQKRVHNFPSQFLVNYWR